MRSFPSCTTLVVSGEVIPLQYAQPAVSNTDGLRRLPGNSLGLIGERLGCRDIPAQGLTPPLLPKQGDSPLDPFLLARSRGVG